MIDVEAHAIRPLRGGGHVTAVAPTEEAAAQAAAALEDALLRAGAWGRPTFEIVLIDEATHATLAETQAGLDGWDAALGVCRAARAQHGSPIVARLCNLDEGGATEWTEEDLAG
jgi:hypothetical protein